MAEITVYEKPTCSTCRRLVALLRERGVDFDSVDYHVGGLAEDELRGLLDKAGLRPVDVLRRREAPAAGRDADALAALDDDALIAEMVAHPPLVERPIVVRGDRAVLARPVERVLELLDDV
ncbi:arsenate reductase [Baekduia soli]|uniref:Arsenate reductase n=1 Tax=Baekduia soli TaxID=496014 RepID=A0A5B8U442_9ACTN|nr:ArsC/Spx/MgsR family protein [Baekduia soli]QEC47790.1 arsenate reductase [Baekduia soli]